MFAALAVAFVFGTPAPLDMPRAEAYYVRENGVARLEDRYNTFDLWSSRAVEGRWFDDDNRAFALSRLEFAPPALLGGATETRADYVSSRVRLSRRDFKGLWRAIDLLSPVPIADEPAPPRQLPRGDRDVDYWQGTNADTIVCAFLPEKCESWYLAVWELAEGDDFAERVEVFEEGFLGREFPKRFADRGKTIPPPLRERELLRDDAHHSVSNYPDWHWTDSDEFTVLDNLDIRRDFIVTLTNELSEARARYAATVPTPLDGTNTLAVARIYRTREEYLEAAGEDMAWSAAYWSPLRRELVAHLGDGGVAELLRTLRHEAFHQYLSYAASMISASPWFNEGYAQYFEDEGSADWGMEVDLELLARAIPGVMAMDYGEFYSGSDQERRLKYRLAWSIAYFIEKGAPLVRFEPFKDLKRDYVAALLKTRDMRKATAAAFGSADNLNRFISEWAEFWKER